MDFLKPARTEILAIEQTIAAAMVRLKDLRAFVEAGERLYGVPTAVLQEQSSKLEFLSANEMVQRLNSSASSARPFLVRRSSGANSKAKRIISCVEQALSNGNRMQSKELVDILLAANIELGGDPIANLSAYLSRSGLFVSERAKGGWSIIQSHKEENPIDAPTSIGS